MAAGSITLFTKFIEDLGEGGHNLETQSFRIGLIDGVLTPTAATADPHWGPYGATNLKTREGIPGGNYITDGADLGNCVYSSSGSIVQFIPGQGVSWAQHINNPTNVVWGIIYNYTLSTKNCVGFIDLGGVFNMATGLLSIAFPTNIFAASQS